MPRHLALWGIICFVVNVYALVAQPKRVPLTMLRQRVVQTNGATIGAKNSANQFEMSGTAGLTVIGPTVSPNRSTSYMGFWIPLKVVATVPDDDHTGGDVATGARVYAWPNPFVDVIQINIEYTDIDEAAIDVYSERGDLLASMKLLQLRQDGILFQWNGQTTDGSTVASGAYVLRIRLRERMTQKRIALSAMITRVG